MKRVLAVVLVLLICGALALGQEAAEEPLPNDYTEKLDAMPSVRQLDDTVLGHGGVNNSLAALASPLLWLNDHGYPGLVPQGDDGTPASTRLMNALADSIGAGNGASLSAALTGLERYCATRGYDAAIEYQGWLDPAGYRVAPQPDLRWILDGVRGDSNVVLLVGRYSHDTAKDLYTLMETYWVPVVGYMGANSGSVQIAGTTQWAGKSYQTGTVTPLKSGTFAAVKEVPAGPAAGWLTLQQRGRIDTTLVVDGAIRFRLQEHPSLVPVQAEMTKPELIQPGSGSFVFVDAKGRPDRPLTVWYHAPADLPASAPIVFVMHGVNRDASRYRNEWAQYAEQYHFLLLVPEFSAAAYPGSRGYNYGNMFDRLGQAIPKQQWAYSAIEHLFDYVKEATGNRSRSYYLFGHSAGAQFVHRMIIFLPEARVRRAVAANAGHYALPTFSQRFPDGLDGTDATPDTLTAAFGKDLVILLSEQDTDEDDPNLSTTPEAMAQGANRWERGHTFWQASQEAARELGADLHWTLRTVPGAKHSDAQVAPTAAALLFE